MAINYSLALRVADPSNPENTKVYANTQYTTIMDLDDFATHLATHNSKYNRADVKGVLTSTVDCMYELLLQGVRLQMDDLGTFYVSIHCEGADTIDDFSPSNITGLTVNWSRGSKFKKIFQDATFNLVGKRETQAAGIASDKQAIRDKQSAQTDGSDTDDGGTTDTGNTGGSGGSSGSSGSDGSDSGSGDGGGELEG